MMGGSLGQATGKDVCFLSPYTALYIGQGETYQEMFSGFSTYVEASLQSKVQGVGTCEQQRKAQSGPIKMSSCSVAAGDGSKALEAGEGKAIYTAIVDASEASKVASTGVGALVANQTKESETQVRSIVPFPLYPCNSFLSQ